MIKKISFEVKKCPNDCNGHGVCNRITGKCKCEFLYGGYDCHGKSWLFQAINIIK